MASGTHEAEASISAHSSARLIRVLHVVGRMQRGGAETLLMHTVRHMDPDRWRNDIVVHSPEPGDYDEEFRALGGRITVCAGPDQPLQYSHKLARILRDQGPYDVVHSHVHYFSGFVLRIARRAGVPVRIAHSHTVAGQDESASLTRRTYVAAAKWLIAGHATAGLAASEEAAEDLFGPYWESDPRFEVFRFGIDLTPFLSGPDKSAVRRELGIPDDAFVVGHVGRFCPEKNHAFLLQIAHELLSLDPSARLLLIGDGELRSAIDYEVRAQGIAGSVVFTGSRSDVPRLLSAMDVFVLPSRIEGLPVAVVEAVAAGLPCVVSEAVPESCLESYVTRLSLAHSASDWAEAICRARSKGVDLSAGAQALVGGPFDITTTVRRLEALYGKSRSSNIPA